MNLLKIDDPMYISISSCSLAGHLWDHLIQFSGIFSEVRSVFKDENIPIYIGVLDRINV